MKNQDKTGGCAKHLGGRLREWRKTIHLKSYELAKIIHISQGSLSDIENEKSLPSADTITKLYQFTDLNIIWLLTNKGPSTRSKMESETGEDYVAEASAEYGQDRVLKELIEKLARIYRRGDAGKKAHLQGFLAGADPGE